MTKCKQKLSWIILLLLCHYVACDDADQETKEDLTQAEAKDGQLEIIKTIKKINEDGSYTIGYEADDGSFKIESRDVLGNVKGTYGYVDEAGEIKRVSYSSSNITDILSEPPSVVQRIPKTNKTYSSTRKPGVLLYNPTTQSTPTSTSVIQSIPRRRATTQTTTTTTSTTTTPKPEKQIYNADVSRSTTRPPNIVYATSIAPRNIVYTQRPLVRSTPASHIEAQKSEGQIIRPEIVTGRPTELPIFRRIALKNPLLENDAPTIKPVTEEPEVRGNLLRRQLSQEKSPPFDARQHVITLQQGLGDDTIDVYSASLTTGTPRPLFTTTSRPRIIPAAQVVVEKPAARYINTPSSIVTKPQTTTEFIQEATTTETTVSEANTPTPVPVYQIPAAQPETPQPPLVAVRHPFHGGVVLVPYNHLRAQENSQPTHQPQYVVANGQYFREIRPTPTPTPEHQQSQAPVFIQRPPILRSIPVQVDENGYVRPIPPQIVTSTPYPITVPITPQPIPKHANGEMEAEIDNIRPPVTTREFQRLIELLIIRQARLEQANAIINAQRQRDLLQLQRYRGIHPTPIPFLVRRPQEVTSNGPVTFIPDVQVPRSRPFITIPMQAAQQHQQQAYVVRPQTQETREVYVQETPVTYAPTPTSYTPTKRVSRLLHNNPPKEQIIDDGDFLPPQIREMLLLRMLQLAINPALPVEENEQEDSMPSEQTIKKTGVRNVEVLGEEEDEEEKPPVRNRRFRGNTKRYYE
ncbi:hypothetical protein ILUMI_20052 [Ignelater luminosus]|uniref:Uncharacterized protein n=1 Tax=Ignelater luminosus TaxID=2038154 RepID=A0A8K0G2M4_IGNLU|nr:hypothetical protein ILUMI_20052 [Ignelater luminosus]